jgi:hypothetical protein
MSSSDNRKHKTLSAKAEIIKKLEKNWKLINLAEEYGVGRATIYDIRKNREKLSVLWKTIDDFFVKMQWNEVLNTELMDKNSQYSFMYVK